MEGSLHACQITNTYGYGYFVEYIILQCVGLIHLHDMYIFTHQDLHSSHGRMLLAQTYKGVQKAYENWNVKMSLFECKAF